MCSPSKKAGEGIGIVAVADFLVLQQVPPVSHFVARPEASFCTGHAAAVFTIDVCGHVTVPMKQASAARMEKFIQSVSGQLGKT